MIKNLKFKKINKISRKKLILKRKKKKMDNLPFLLFFKLLFYFSMKAI